MLGRSVDRDLVGPKRVVISVGKQLRRATIPIGGLFSILQRRDHADIP